jgi:hypothetical protein
MEKRRSGKVDSKGVNRFPARKKALKGEAQECRKLKEASTDLKS